MKGLSKPLHAWCEKFAKEASTYIWAKPHTLRRVLKEAIRATQLEGFLNGRHHEDLVTEESSTELNFPHEVLMKSYKEAI